MSTSPYVIVPGAATFPPGSWDPDRPQAGDATPDGSSAGGGGGGVAVVIGVPASTPGSGTVGGPGTWLTSCSTPKPTRAAVSTPSSA